MRARRHLCRSILVLVATVGLVGCDKPIDLAKALQIEEVSSGWHDAGVADGKNRLVPSVTFKVKNVSDQQLVVLQVNVLFRRLNEEDTGWGDKFVTVSGSKGLEPGATSTPITVMADNGYTGTEARQEMLANSQFVDAKVRFFAKYASTQWVRIAEYPVTRALLSK